VNSCSTLGNYLHDCKQTERSDHQVLAKN